MKSPYSALEEGLTRTAPAKTCCRGKCSLSSGVVSISVLMVLFSLNFLITSFVRSGAPCYHWWKHWATFVTFVVAHVTRVCMLALGCLAVVALRKDPKSEQSARAATALFYLTTTIVAVGFCDVFLVVFEVSEVCNSQEMKEWVGCKNLMCNTTKAWNACCLSEDACSTCAQRPVAAYPAGTKACTPTAAASFCEGKLPSSADSQPLKPSSCELLSTLYDVLLGSLSVVLFAYFVWIVHSFRIEIGLGGSLEMQDEVDEASEGGEGGKGDGDGGDKGGGGDDVDPAPI